LRPDPDAAFIEEVHCDFVPLADGTEDIFNRELDVVEGDYTGGGCADAELLFLLADAEAGGVTGDNEAGYSLVALVGWEGGVGLRKDEEDFGVRGVGDPAFAAVDGVG